MGRAIEVIEKEIRDIEERVKSLAEKLQIADINYLQVLSQCIKHQLIMAAYHLCTQVYPESFLKLSFNQTEQVQKQLKRIIKDWQTELSSFTQDSGSALELRAPIDLLGWQKSLETNVSNYLQIVSASANQILQKAELFPPIPVDLVESAGNIDGLSEAVASSPNLVNVMVENPEIPDNGAPIITSIQAIQLRIMDIEFNSSELMSARHQIRNLLSKLGSLQSEYQQRQGERAIVEAENAWRRSWFDD